MVRQGNEVTSSEGTTMSWTGELWNYQKVWIEYAAIETHMYPYSEINDKQVIHRPVICQGGHAWGLRAAVCFCRAQQLLASCQLQWHTSWHVAALEGLPWSLSRRRGKRVHVCACVCPSTCVCLSLQVVERCGCRSIIISSSRTGSSPNSESPHTHTHTHPRHTYTHTHKYMRSSTQKPIHRPCDTAL